MSETRQAYQEEMERIEASALEGLDMVVQSIDRAMTALADRDARLAALVVADDDRIDGRYLEVHQSVLTLIAREAPVATDLRLAAALLHTIRHVERMGDQCVNICKLVPLLGHDPPVVDEIAGRIQEMGRLACLQTEGAKRCFTTRSVELAEVVAADDATINRLNRDIFQLALEAGTDFDTREWATCMMLVARCLERIGDNAVDVCEQAAFVVTGLFRELSDASRPVSLRRDDEV